MSDINTTAPTLTDRVGEDVGRLERVRHLKRGTEYEVLHDCAEIQASPDSPLTDYEICVVYRSLTDGRVWVRRRPEFRDGRFETIASAPAPSDPAGAGGDLGELERLSAKATSGEWSAEEAGRITAAGTSPGYDIPVWGTILTARDTKDIEAGVTHWATDGERQANARFVAALVNAYRSGQIVASTPRQKGAGEEKTGAPAPGVLWSAWSETDADSDPSDPGVTYCTEWFVGRWPIGAEEPDCRILIGTSRSAEIIARRVAENLTSILNTDRIRAAPSGWRTDCFRTRMSEFDAAYKKACASSQPKDWMDAALSAQQFRNVAYAVLTGEAPEQEIPNKLRLKPCLWEEEHLCSYPKCNCAPDREPDPPASCDEHPQGEDPQGALGSRVLIQVIDSGYYYCAFNEGVTDRISDAFVYDLEEAEYIVRHDCATLRIIPAPCVSDEHPAGEDAIAAEGEACQRGGEAETPAQTPPSPPSATPEGAPPMTVEEARDILDPYFKQYSGGSQEALEFAKWMAGRTADEEARNRFLATASRIELALRTLHAAGEVSHG